MSILIHHNPGCGTSRNVLAIVKAAGYQPIVNEYLQTGWTRPQLLGLFAAAGLTLRQALRTRKSPAQEMKLSNPDVDEEMVLAAMVENPVLVERPIVCSPKGVRLCRPAESVLELLEQYPDLPLFKKDGTLLLDSQGKLSRKK